MTESRRVRRRWWRRPLAAAFSAALMFTAGHPSSYEAESLAYGRLVRYRGAARLDGDMCLIPAAVQRAERMAAYAQRRRGGLALGPRNDGLRRRPGPQGPGQDPAFAAIGFDHERNEVVVTDENLFQVLVYDRLENTPRMPSSSKPKRVLAGDNTLIEFESGIYIDPKSGDIAAPNNDTVDTLVVFAQGSNGDVAPKRALQTPHGTFGVAVDEKRGEMFLDHAARLDRRRLPQGSRQGRGAAATAAGR